MDRAACQRLDRECPLAPVRERFSLPEGVLYFDGNSLGALPKTTAADLDRLVREDGAGTSSRAGSTPTGSSSRARRAMPSLR